MRIKMNYGRNGLMIDFPDAWDITVIEKTAMPVLAGPAGAVFKALARACRERRRRAESRRLPYRLYPHL